METHNVKWQVSLSNGETLFEDKGDYKEKEGVKSPWQRLREYTLSKKLDITSLALYIDDGRTFNLPSSGKSPRFREFANLEKPLDFNVCRHIARQMDIIGDSASDVIISDKFTVAEAHYKNYVLQLWVDEFHPENAWVLVIER